MKLKFKIKEKEYEVEILEEEEKIKIKIGGRDFFFETPEQAPRIAQTSLPKKDFSEKEISAPLAGLISEIFVREGEMVKKKQKILLISAMKMENEIISDFDGLVKKILVQKNQEVKEGDTLIVLQ